MSTSHARPCAAAGRPGVPSSDGECTDCELPFDGPAPSWLDAGESASGMDTLCQLAVLLLRFERVSVRMSVSSDARPCTLLLQSSYVRSELDRCAAGMRLGFELGSGLVWSCIWIAVIVLRTNCERDMRACSSATWRSVFSKRSEYETACTRSVVH